MSNKLKYRLPQNIRQLLFTYNGWLVGGCFKQILTNSEPKDYDIIIPCREDFAKFIKANEGRFKINSYGGLKIEDGVSIDVWCEELGHYLVNANNIVAVYNYNKNIFLKIEK